MRGPLRGDRLALIYCRVLTKHQAEKWSLPAQRRALEEYATKQNWQYEVLEETGSGETIEARPVFRRVLERIAAGETHTLLVIEAERLTRAKDLRELAVIQEACRAGNCRVATPQQSLDLGDAEDSFIHSLFGILSAREKQKLLARQKRGMAEAKAAGRWHGGGVPTGYRYDRDKRTIVPDDRAGEVRELLEAALTRGARALRDLWPSWSPTAIQRAISRQRVWWYAGKVELEDGELIQAAWEPIITEDLANALHRARDKKKIVRHGVRGGPKRLLTGLGIFYCGSCGVTMKSHTITKVLVDGVTRRRYYYYRCNPWWVQGAAFVCANRHGIPCQQLDAQVLAAVWRELPGLAAAEGSRAAPEGPAQPSPVARDLEVTKARRDRLVAALEDGTVTAGEARDRLVELRAQIARLSAEVQRERPEGMELSPEIRDLLRRAPGKVPLAEARTVLAAAIERIEIDGRERLRIRWMGGQESMLQIIF